VTSEEHEVEVGVVTYDSVGSCWVDVDWVWSGTCWEGRRDGDDDLAEEVGGECSRTVQVGVDEFYAQKEGGGDGVSFL